MSPEVVIALINLARIVVEQLSLAMSGAPVDFDKIQQQTEELRSIVDDWRAFKAAKQTPCGK